MIITNHEHAQRESCRNPWPIYSTWPHCSGPCKQGRSLCLTPEACQSGEVEVEDPPLTQRNAWIGLGCVLACFGVVAGLVWLVWWLA